jgi:hypothetical protein
MEKILYEINLRYIPFRNFIKNLKVFGREGRTFIE